MIMPLQLNPKQISEASSLFSRGVVLKEADELSRPHPAQPQ